MEEKNIMDKIKKGIEIAMADSEKRGSSDDHELHKPYLIKSGIINLKPPEPFKRICVDFDNTLVRTHGSDYEHVVPYYNRISSLNSFYDMGIEIIIYSARGDESGIDYTKLTVNQLEKYGIKYHKLMKKPWASIYIDDLNKSPEFLGVENEY